MNSCLTTFEAKLALEQLFYLTSLRKANVNSVFSLLSIGVVGASGKDGGSGKGAGSGGGV